MQRKITIGQAISKAKCPRCRKGDIFFHPWYKIRKFHKTHKHCPECGLLFEREPGFFFGAMYVSYAFIVALAAAVAVVLYFLLGDPDIWVYVAAVYAAIVLSLPLIFRYSRVTYLYLFGGVSYDEDYIKR